MSLCVVNVKRFSLVALVVIVLVVRSNAFNEYEDIDFELHTRKYEQSWELLNASHGVSINLTEWNPNRPTRIFVHGFKSKRKVINRYAEAFLKADNYNFIAVNWMKGSSTINYYVAKNRVKKVGRVLAVFIDYLAEHGLVLGDLVIVGHSLGAHISGYAGKNIKSGRIGAIIGLDPAGPLFSIDKPQKRLADTDADYVQIIHTDAGNLSVEHPIGHADFYPNGGNEQPGCSKGNALTSYLKKCSHSKSHAFFLESLQLGVRFPAIQCVSYEEIERNECTVVNQETEFLMGGDLPAGKPRPHGIFYLETNIVPPYAIPDTNEFKAISRSSYS